MRLQANQRLLVRTPSWLGDFVQAEPALRTFDRAVAEGALGGLSLAGPEHLLGLFEGRFPHARRLPLAHGGRERAADWRGHDVALLFNGSARSLWCALRAGIPSRLSWGSGGRALLATESFRPSREAGAAAEHVGLRRLLSRPMPRPFDSSCRELAGWVGFDVRECRPHLRVSEAGREAVALRRQELGLDAGSPYLCLNASARPSSSKGLPAEFWAALLVELAAGGAPRCVLLTAPEEERVAREALRLAGAGPRAVLPEPAPALGELLAWIEGCALLITPDSGPRHLATALDTPAVVLFGPTDPRHSAGHLQGQRLLHERIACGPCHDERCPLVGERRDACMRAHAATRVAAHALESVACATRPTDA